MSSGEALVPASNVPSGTSGPSNLAVETGSTGLYSGCVISKDGASTFAVSAGTGTHSDVSVSPPVETPWEYAGGTFIAPDFLATHPVTYLSMSKLGVLIQRSTPVTNEQRRDETKLGVVVHSDNTTVLTQNNQPSVVVNVAAQLHDMMKALGLFNIAGNVIAANGATLGIKKSAGELFDAGGNFDVNPKDPHVRSIADQTPVTFRYRNQNSVEGSDVTVIDPTQWDDAGTDTVVANANNATLQRVSIFPSGIIRVQRGQEVFSNLSAAIDALNTSSPVIEPNIDQNGLLLCTLAVKKGCTDLSDTDDARFFVAGPFGDVSGSGSSAVGTFIDIYRNSIQPHITTDDTHGAVQFQRGTTGGDEDVVFEILNGSGTTTRALQGDGSIEVIGISTPTDFPAVGNFKKYMKSDGKLYVMDSSGTETEVGAGGGGGGASGAFIYQSSTLSTSNYSTTSVVPTYVYRTSDSCTIPAGGAHMHVSANFDLYTSTTNNSAYGTVRITPNPFTGSGTYTIGSPFSRTTSTARKRYAFDQVLENALAGTYTIEVGHSASSGYTSYLDDIRVIASYIEP